ncbi:MAG: chorismate mutase family protein [Bacteroidaceae bacterium]|nr:chorismate mutase family protein [Bacteroidaceae bacterium]
MLNINSKKPSECTNIAEVRNEIDRIDHVIIDLLSQRFQYVKEVVKYKDSTPGSIEAPERRRAVLECRRRWAEECGLNADVVERMYDNLIQYFIDEEKKIKNI